MRQREGHKGDKERLHRPTHGDKREGHDRNHTEHCLTLAHTKKKAIKGKVRGQKGPR